MGLRVEELAERAGTSVDTVRFYQGQRLLEPPRREGRVAWYDESHLERIERIRELQRKGFTLAVIRRLDSGELDVSDEPLAAAVAGADDAEEFLDLDQLARRSGVPRALIEAVVREGLLVPRRNDGDARFTPADVDVVAAGLALVEAGLPLPGLLELASRHHRSTRELAAGAVELFDQAVRQPLQRSELGDDERAERLVAAFRAVLPAVTAIVTHHFQRVLLAVAEEHLEAVGQPAELAAAQAEARRRLEALRQA